MTKVKVSWRGQDDKMHGAWLTNEELQTLDAEVKAKGFKNRSELLRSDPSVLDRVRAPGTSRVREASVPGPGTSTPKEDVSVPVPGPESPIGGASPDVGPLTAGPTTSGGGPPTSQPSPVIAHLADLEKEITKRFPNIDFASLQVALATYISGYEPVVPVWLLFVEAASGTKSTMEKLMYSLPGILRLDDYTSAGVRDHLLNLFDREHVKTLTSDDTKLLEKRRSGGFIPKLLWLVDDLSLFIKKNQLDLAFIRAVYEGSYRTVQAGRGFISSGGFVTFLGSVTSEWDALNEEHMALGPRFIIRRPKLKLPWRLDPKGYRQSIQELQPMVLSLLDSLTAAHGEVLRDFPMSSGYASLLQKIVQRVVVWRSIIRRNPMTGELEDLPSREHPPRLFDQLWQLSRGLMYLREKTNCDDDTFAIIADTAFDCVPGLRMDFMERLYAIPDTVVVTTSLVGQPVMKDKKPGFISDTFLVSILPHTDLGLVHATARDLALLDAVEIITKEQAQRFPVDDILELTQGKGFDAKDEYYRLTSEAREVLEWRATIFEKAQEQRLREWAKSHNLDYDIDPDKVAEEYANEQALVDWAVGQRDKEEFDEG